MKNGKRPGQTLIEVAMATIVAAMTTTAIFSVILSSFASQVKADKREAAAMVVKRAQETLKSYVSVAPLSANLFNSAPPQPGSPNGGHWAADSYAGWALQSGVQHDISSLLNGTVLNGGSFSYSIANVNPPCLGAGVVGEFNQCKAVQFNLTYSDN